MVSTERLAPSQVHPVIKKYLIGDGTPIVFDLERSHGPWIYDSLGERELLDLMSQFASQPIGYNHPGLRDPTYLQRLHEAAAAKIANSDLFTVLLAECLEAYANLAGHGDLPLWFFIEGGALGVENALKAAFDWKVQTNLKAGRAELGSQVIHFRKAFHGRTGYTLSLTNTADPRKTLYYPKFDWPRISSPAIRHPLDDAANLEATTKAEARALEEIDAAFREREHDIASILLEPIQAEGGDNHFRPEFLVALRRIADEREAMLIFDEVQTGGGITGTMWAFEQLEVVPDAVAFAKKLQVGGLMASRRFEEVDSVFEIPSRINSTWGGNLVDMVRGSRYLELIHEESMLENVGTVGKHLLDGLRTLADRHPAVSNVRGRGLLIAFDLPDTETRNALRASLLRRGVVILGCGEKSLRLRPVLDFPKSAADGFLETLESALVDSSRQAS